MTCHSSLPDSVSFWNKIVHWDTLPDSVCFLKCNRIFFSSLDDSQPTASTFLVSCIENTRRRNPATFLELTFFVFFSDTIRLGFTSQCEFTRDAASLCRLAERNHASEERLGSFKARRKRYVDWEVGKKVTLRQSTKQRISKHRISPPLSSFYNAFFSLLGHCSQVHWWILSSLSSSSFHLQQRFHCSLQSS